MLNLDPSIPSKILVAGAAQFSYLERGKGAALVLLHGLGSAARSWQHQLAGLSETFHVIAWDAPGYGRSSGLEAESPDAGDYARSLATFLDRLGVRKLHLVGQSLGAIMAARFAAEHPERILSLTLTSPASGDARLPDEERVRHADERLEDLITLGPRGFAEKRGPRLVSANAPEETRNTAIETMAMIRPDGYSRALRMLSGADSRADVARLRADLRVQFILGDADEITRPESIRAIAAARPEAPVHVVPGAGHAVYLERPVDFNALVREFLTGP
jgi:pimeloyl-ACP methyl ester carboxylesterase